MVWTRGCGAAHADVVATSVTARTNGRSRRDRTGLQIIEVPISIALRLAWQTLRRNAERQGDLAQLRLHDALVLVSHAHQLLLRRRQPFLARIGKGVDDSVWLHARRT